MTQRAHSNTKMNKKAAGTLTLIFYLIAFLIVFFGFLVPLINVGLGTYSDGGIFGLVVNNLHIVILGVVVLVLIAAVHFS